MKVSDELTWAGCLAEPPLPVCPPHPPAPHTPVHILRHQTHDIPFFYIRHISVQYFPSIYTCCSTTIHIKPHISPQLQPLVFVYPQSERWWINKSCHGGREAPPFKSHLFANWGNSSKSFDRITQSTFGDFTIITFAVSEWKTSSAAKSVCMLVTRKRIRLSCKAGNSSWSSEFPVLGQRWKDFCRTIIYFDM